MFIKVPSILNIISVLCFDTERLLFEINNSCIVIRKDGLYDDKHVFKITRGSSCLWSDETLLWHHCLGHVKQETHEEIATNKSSRFFWWHSNLACESCDQITLKKVKGQKDCWNGYIQCIWSNESRCKRWLLVLHYFHYGYVLWCIRVNYLTRSNNIRMK